MERTTQIKSKIKSVSGTGKITGAMELVASSKIRTAQQRILEARPFIGEVADIIAHIACYSPMVHPLLTPHEQTESVLVVGITADRGLCGGYNTNIIRVIENTIRRVEKEGKHYQLDIIGGRGINYFKYIGLGMNNVYEHLSDHPKFLDAREIAIRIIDRYLSRKINQVIICYTKFINAAEQVPSSFQILPVPFLEESIEQQEDDGIGLAIVGDRVCKIKPEYTYDPGPEQVLGSLIPEYIYTIVYMALLESSASETGARMTAMKHASDNAEEMIKDLTVEYHRSRQQQITMEISEIVSGSEALSGI
ncbi:MAG: ATP synthase F1 subunit gamma [Actinobacteria bacterium]|nr:ATP synthase F1 subunit gamma [Actinomycetota bacterium]